MVMPYSAEEKIELKLGDTGSYIYGGTYGGTTYDGLCTYCGTNKNFLKAFDSVAFSNCNTRCCRGQCPPGSTILPVPYHNQCEWGDSTYCTGACGPVSMIMALEFAAQNGAQFDPKYMDIKWVWNDLIKKGSCVPGSCGSSGFWGDIAAAAGVQGGSYGGVQWESWQKEIDNGNTVIINNHMDLDGEQRCEPVDTYHWFLLVGYSKDFAIVNDPYVPRSCPQQSGDHLVLTRGKFEKLCGYEFSNCGAYVIKGG